MQTHPTFSNTRHISKNTATKARCACPYHGYEPSLVVPCDQGDTLTNVAPILPDLRKSFNTAYWYRLFPELFVHNGDN